MHIRSPVLPVSALFLILCVAVLVAGCSSSAPAYAATPAVPIPPATAVPSVAETTINPPNLPTTAAMVPVSPTPLATAAIPTPAVSGVMVTIQNLEFNPGTITVRIGATVRWTNLDDVPHDVTSTGLAPVAFKSATLRKGETYEWTFTQAGTYPYYCSIHPFMKGSVVVTA